MRRKFYDISTCYIYIYEYEIETAGKRKNESV